MKILVIEDDEVIVDTIRLTFQVGWPAAEVLSAQLGEEGLKMAESVSPEAVILDLGLPDINGFEVLKAIRLFSIVPVVVLTVQADERSVIKALEMGADDYIVKPFRQLELLARIKSAIRSRNPEFLSVSAMGPFQFDASGRRMKYRNRQINLTSTEFLILRYLVLNQGNVVTHDQLARQIWGTCYPGFGKTLRVYISHLRKKIESSDGREVIVSQPGVGYYLSRDV